MDYKALAEQIVKTARDRAARTRPRPTSRPGARCRSTFATARWRRCRRRRRRAWASGCSCGGRMAFASCNDLAQASLDNAVGRAIEFARSTTADPNNVLPTDRGDARRSRGSTTRRIAKVPMERKIELAIRLEAMAMKDPRITKSAGAGYGEGEAEIFLANSNGLSKTLPTVVVLGRRVGRRREGRAEVLGRRSRAPGASSRTSSAPEVDCRQGRRRAPSNCSTRAWSRRSARRSSSIPTSPGRSSAASSRRSTARACCSAPASWRRCSTSRSRRTCSR